MFQRSRGMAVLLTLLLALLLCAAGAFAQSGTSASYDIDLSDQVTVNTCSAGEPVALNGTVHVQSSVTTESTGVNNFTVSVANNLTGIGQTTGTSYVAADSDEYSSNTSDASVDITVELRSQLKSLGTTPNLMLVQLLHITADTSGNLSAQVVSSTTGCGS
jgi:hypothetical protein